jgi:hypothetical protein
VHVDISPRTTWGATAGIAEARNSKAGRPIERQIIGLQGKFRK